MSLFKQYKPEDNLPERKSVTIELEGTLLQVPETTTVAAAVLSHGEKNHIRLSPASGEKRAPFCFMGVCHECLVEIDGIPNQQACIIEVKEGMKIKLQLGLPGGDE